MDSYRTYSVYIQGVLVSPHGGGPPKTREAQFSSSSTGLASALIHVHESAAAAGKFDGPQTSIDSILGKHCHQRN